MVFSLLLHLLVMGCTAFSEKNGTCGIRNPEHTSSCDWGTIVERFNNKFPSQTYKNHEIICVNHGKWSEHSRAPCDVGINPNADIKQVYAYNCHSSLKKNKLICSTKVEVYHSSIKGVLDYVENKLVCSCDNKDPGKLLSETCKWKIGVKFKPGGADYSLAESIMVAIFVILLIIIVLLALMSDDCSSGWGCYYYDGVYDNAGSSIVDLFVGESD